MNCLLDFAFWIVATVTVVLATYWAIRGIRHYFDGIDSSGTSG